MIFQAFDTADGQVIVAAANDRLFAKFATEVGHPEWVTDARYKTNADRHANKDTLLPRVREIMRQHSRARRGWRASRRRACRARAINDIEPHAGAPQTAALGMVQPVPEIDLGLMSLPLSLDGERPSIRTRAPKLGEHNAAVEGLPKVKAKKA